MPDHDRIHIAASNFVATGFTQRIQLGPLEQAFRADLVIIQTSEGSGVVGLRRDIEAAAPASTAAALAVDDALLVVTTGSVFPTIVIPGPFLLLPDQSAFFGNVSVAGARIDMYGHHIRLSMIDQALLTRRSLSEGG